MNNIQLIEITKLIPWETNARKHSQKQLKQIASSIKEFGFTNPILIDEKHHILAGHGRVEAAKLLDMKQVPCLYIEHMNDTQKRAYVLADNKIALNSSWDEELLADELEVLSAMDLGFDMELTGFSAYEIDNLIDMSAPEEDNNPKDDKLPSQYPKRAKLGDIWLLGRHKLICADSLDQKAVQKLMNKDKAQMIFTDPPYNVPIQGHVSGKGKTQHKEFAMAAGEMSKLEFTEFLKKAFSNLSHYSRDGSIHFICMDWRHMAEVMDAANDIYDELKNLIVWVKDSGGMGTFYRSRHELIFVYKKGTKAHMNNFELGQHGRYRTNVWECRGANSEELKMHPTVKPVQMISDAIKDVSKRGDIILDLFGGSGSTLIAAEKTSRRAYLCELDPDYCDLILARYEAYAKDEALKLGNIYEEGEK